MEPEHSPSLILAQALSHYFKWSSIVDAQPEINTCLLNIQEFNFLIKIKKKNSLYKHLLSKFGDLS